MLQTTDNANWKVIPLAILNQFGKDLLILQMNIDSIKSLPKTKIPQRTPFYI